MGHREPGPMSSTHTGLGACLGEALCLPLLGGRVSSAMGIHVCTAFAGMAVPSATM